MHFKVPDIYNCRACLNKVILKWLQYILNIINLQTRIWTDAWRPVPRLWIRSAEVRGNVVRRMGTQQQTQTRILIAILLLILLLES